jgi:lipopolysaccharide biosynthesis glycosyltransferase
MDKKNAIAVLADEGHLEKTKQIIYSSYVDGNWQGEYILLAHQIANADALKWFEERGIHIHHIDNEMGVSENQPKVNSIYFSKLSLFHPDFAKWHRILYLDTDMVIQWDINALVEVEGFAAANDCARFNLWHQFSPREGWLSEDEKRELFHLFSDYDLDKTAFNAGMMVIDSGNNTEKRFGELMDLVDKYHAYSTYGDQGILNLYFQKSRIKLPYVYNDFYQSDDFNRIHFLRRRTPADAIILHITYPYKPWDERSMFYPKWKDNTEKADQLFQVKQIGKKPAIWRKWRTEFINAFNIWWYIRDRRLRRRRERF